MKNLKNKRRIKIIIAKHEGAGHWIGSCFIVIANSEEEAETLIRKKLDLYGLHNENINIVKTWDIDCIITENIPVFLVEDSGVY